MICTKSSAKLHKRLHDISCILPIDLHDYSCYYIDRSREAAATDGPRTNRIFPLQSASFQKKKEIRTMSKNEMITMIETMNNYDDLAAKAKAKADAIREAIKEEMIRQDTEELVAGAYIVRFTSVISNRFDSTTFKRLYADLYKDFTKPVSSRRFSVSC